MVFKILLLTYKALNGLSPLYFRDPIVPFIPERTLRSQSAGLFVVPRMHTITLGGRAVSYQAVLLRNHLANWVQEADSTCAFKITLKTFLFSKVLIGLITVSCHSYIRTGSSNFHSSNFSIALLLQAYTAGDTNMIHWVVPHFPNINHHFLSLLSLPFIFFSLELSVCPVSPAVLHLPLPLFSLSFSLSLQVSCRWPFLLHGLLLVGPVSAASAACIFLTVAV